MGTFFVKCSPINKISPDVFHISISWCALFSDMKKSIFSEQKHLVSKMNGLFEEQLSKQMWFLLLSFCSLILKSGPIDLD